MFGEIDDIHIVFAAIFVVFVAAIAALYVKEKEWDEFKEKHKCKVVAHISGDVFNTVGVSGSGNVTVGVGSTPDKDGWICDDGITYYR